MSERKDRISATLAEMRKQSGELPGVDPRRAARLSGERLFSYYLSTPLFGKTFGEAKSYYSEPKLWDHNDERPTQRLRGRVWQDLVSILAPELNRSQGVTLNEQQTLLLYRQMFPELKRDDGTIAHGVVRNPLGFDSISGISVPDLVVIESHRRMEGFPKIVSAVEATLNVGRKRTDKKRHGFISNWQRHKRYFVASPAIEYHVPGNTYLPTGFNSLRNTRVRVVENMTHFELEEAVDRLFYSHKSQRRRETLAEIYQESLEHSQRPRFAIVKPDSAAV